MIRTCLCHSADCIVGGTLVTRHWVTAMSTASLIRGDPAVCFRSMNPMLSVVQDPNASRVLARYQVHAALIYHCHDDTHQSLRQCENPVAAGLAGRDVAAAASSEFFTLAVRHKHLLSMTQTVPGDDRWLCFQLGICRLWQDDTICTYFHIFAHRL